MKTHLPAASAFAAIAAFFLSAPGTAADDAADFYKGRMAARLVGFSPGGSQDMFARFFQPHFAEHMPGNSNFNGPSALRKNG